MQVKLLKKLAVILVTGGAILLTAWLINLLMTKGAFLFTAKMSGNSPFASPIFWLIVVLAVIWGLVAKWQQKRADKRFEKSLLESLKKPKGK